MYITLSVATSADHYIDDMSSERLVLSTAEDWAAVYALRAAHDAILVGGETLRRDNPSLGIKGEGVEPTRVVVSGRGDISPDAKIFHRGSGRIIIFSNIERPELKGIAEVIVSENIDVAQIVTQLEKRAIKRLFVEGGAKILNLFLESGVVDSLRVATNPNIIVNDPSAPRFIANIEATDITKENLGGMDVTTYRLRDDRSQPSAEDRAMMGKVVEVSRLSPPRNSCYRVGALIKTLSGATYEGYTLETSPTHHAEQAAIHKAKADGAELAGATIYSSIEPCSTRSSEPKSCSELILEYKFSRVIFALYEPSHFVICRGAENLRRQGVEVIYMDEFETEVREINAHVLK